MTVFLCHGILIKENDCTKFRKDSVRCHEASDSSDLLGMSTAAVSHALNDQPCLEITWAGKESDLLQWCGEQAEKLFRNGGLPDAILACSDMVAVKILEAAEACGLRIPEDLSLIGFDNISFGNLPQMELTTVSQQKFQAGRLAVDRLLEKIGGENTQTKDILQPELIIRTTCRKKE